MMGQKNNRHHGMRREVIETGRRFSDGGIEGRILDFRAVEADLREAVRRGNKRDALIATGTMFKLVSITEMQIEAGGVYDVAFSEYQPKPAA